MWVSSTRPEAAFLITFTLSPQGWLSWWLPVFIVIGQLLRYWSLMRCMGAQPSNPPPHHPKPNDLLLRLIKKRGAVREVGQKASSWFCSSEAGAANKHTAHIVTVTHFLLGTPPIFCSTHIDTHDYPSCCDADLPQVACCSVACSYWRHLT